MINIYYYLYVQLIYNERKCQIICDNVIKPKKSKSEKRYIREYLKIITTSKGEKQKMLLEDLIKKSQNENVDIIKYVTDLKSELESRYFKC